MALWAIGGWAAEVIVHVRRPLWDPPQAALWHREPDSPRVRRLRHFLNKVDAALPERSRIAVAVPVSDDVADRMFRYLWIAYLMPRHVAVPAWRAGAAGIQYWASFRDAGAAPAGAEEIARWPDGALYRVAPQAADGTGPTRQGQEP